MYKRSNTMHTEYIASQPNWKDCYYPNSETTEIWGREQSCALEKFFKDQLKLPPAMRSSGALLVCFCPRCRINMGTL
jgi:hypothetical protein